MNHDPSTGSPPANGPHHEQHDEPHHSAEHWERQRQLRPLRLLHQAAQRVPAYRKHLLGAGIDPASIETFDTFEAFQRVPSIDKQTYLKAHSLPDLCWDGTLERPLTFSATSGSSGEPFYFPRSAALARQSSWIHQTFIRHGEHSHGHRGPTLVVVGFGMGVWIGGSISVQAFDMVARRGRQPLSILAPGINKAEILGALRRLAPQFSQTILVGYPPFLKDVVDAAADQGIDLQALNLRFSCAAEPFSEDFRDYLIAAAGSADACLDTLNIYGSADIGAMANETPLSIAIRRLAVRHRDNGLFESIFGAIDKTPTLAQYDPRYITFEARDGQLLLTGDNTIPLIRYAIGDRGSITSYRDMLDKLARAGMPIDRLIDPSWPASAAPPLPFVHVYERTDSSTTLYGLQVYPEPIRDALLRSSITHRLTGNFVMATRFDADQNQYLEINLEMREGAALDDDAQRSLIDEIVTALQSGNSEYRELLRMQGTRAWPRLVAWPAGDPRYFSATPKRRWVASEAA